MSYADKWIDIEQECITVENFSPLVTSGFLPVPFTVDVVTGGTIDSVIVEWGDGSSDPMVAGVPPSYGASHGYPDVGEYLAKVIVTLTTGETNGPDGEWFKVQVPYLVSDPSASAVTFSGTCERFQTLTMAYTYSGTNPEGTSVFQWFKRLSSGDPWEAILGADMSTFTLTPDEVGYEVIASVKPVDNMGNIGFRVFSSTTCTVVAGAFLPYDIDDTVCIWNVDDPTYVTTDGGVPDRVTDIIDFSYFNAYNAYDVNTDGPVYDPSGFATFFSADQSLLGPNGVMLPIPVGSDITIVLYTSIASLLGTGVMHINFQDNNNSLRVVNEALRIVSGGTIYDSASTPFVDDVRRVHVIRSNATNGFEWSVDGVSYLTNISHLLNYDITSFRVSRTTLPYQGDYVALQFITRYITDAERTQLINYYQSL